MAKVLVVDDAAFMRMRIRKLLEDNGYQVVEAQNGREAIARYQEESPDLVLMDITMPEMDGLEALREIRKIDGLAKIVVCSALGQQSVVLEAIQSGAKDFVVKPYDPARLLKSVAKWTSETSLSTGG
jgi:two-component system chemotaxis response regulator CheY